MHAPLLRGVLVLAVLASLLTGCGGDSKPPAAPDDSVNVLFVTLDTTRADRLGCYGYEAAETPTYDRLAAEGVRFDNAYCQVPLTLPSHASMMTGTWPAVNGIRINAGGVVTEATPTLAKAFQDRGYRTGAFTSIVVLHEHFGLDQGFDVYDNVSGDKARRSGTQERTQRRATETTDLALDWLGEAPGAPFFLWLHLTDPHWPVDPPAPFDQFEDPYDGEIAYTDSEVGRIVRWLESQGELDSTLIVVTADHGESLGEHGEEEHGIFVYRSTMRVPLLLRAPDLLPAGQVVNVGVELVSIMPTIFDLFGWDPGYELDGRSFAGAWRTADFPFDPVYTESQNPRLGFGWAPLRAFTTEKWHFVDAPRPELYDREHDVNELVNVAHQHPEAVETFQELMRKFEEGLEPRELRTADLEAAGITGLESLGYTGGSVPVPTDGELRDPKDMIGVVNRYVEAVHVAAEGEYERAISLLEGLTQESPESDTIFRVLGQAYLGARRFAEAQTAFENSLRNNQDDAGNLCGLGDSFFHRNMNKEAQVAYEAALEQEPDYAQVHSRLGVVYARLGNQELAKEHFERYVELEPDSPNALTNLANMEMAEGQWLAAGKRLKQALAIDPGCLPAADGLHQVMRAGGIGRNELRGLLRDAHERAPQNASLASRYAWVIATDARSTRAEQEQAVVLARPLIEAAPQDVIALDAYAAACAATGNYNDALIYLERCLQIAQTRRPQLVPALEQRRELYRAQRPYHE